MSTAAAAPMYRWHQLPWKKFQRTVYQLQKRIYQAAPGTYDKRHGAEEPCESKDSRTVLEPSRGGDIPA